MVGLIILIILSWGLLWLFDKSNLWILGINPTIRRNLDLTFGFLASSFICAFSFILIILLSKTKLTINTDYSLLIFLKSFFWVIKSVLTEEFFFRGALLYIAIKKIGIKGACILASIAFGIYHWFSYGVLGNIPQMIYIFILTGIGGLVFSYAFALTKSLYLPIGLHLGWNFVTVVVFSQGPLGKQLLISSGGQLLGILWSIFFFIYQVVVLAFVTYWYLKRHKNLY